MAAALKSRCLIRRVAGRVLAMMTRTVFALLALLGLLAVACARTGPTPAQQTAPQSNVEPDWQPWSKAAFEQARREHKLLLVSVQAGWCHWCHVMNASTYRDARVVALLRERFIAIRVDQDSRPDLAERYADWGWPATGILTPDARTIVNLRGHQPADAFRALLLNLVNELDHGGPLSARQAPLPAPLPRSDLDVAWAEALAQLDAAYDQEQGGWGTPQKYPLAAPVEHALLRALTRHEKDRASLVMRTLNGYAQLLDPVAGGLFQYSLRGVWDAPHYEKIAPVQAGALRVFSEAYRATSEPSFRHVAERAAQFVTTVLRAPTGGFYASQDADVGHPGERDHLEGIRYYALGAEARASAKAPSVDRHIYANMNGMLIRGLCALHRATGDARWLDAALGAARDVDTLRDGPGFRHQRDDAGRVFYLADQVEMAAAYDALADETLDPARRSESDNLLDYISSAFADEKAGGLFAHTPDANAVGELALPVKPYADNALTARLLLRRAHRNAAEADRSRALAILRALSDQARMRDQGRMIGDYLLALEEALGPYVMFSVVGNLADARTRALANAAHALYAPNALLNVATPERSRYPYPGRPAVYLCSENACSAPVTEASDLAAALQGFGEE